MAEILSAIKSRFLARNEEPLYLVKIRPFEPNNILQTVSEGLARLLPHSARVET